MSVTSFLHFTCYNCIITTDADNILNILSLNAFVRVAALKTLEDSLSFKVASYYYSVGYYCRVKKEMINSVALS